MALVGYYLAAAKKRASTRKSASPNAEESSSRTNVSDANEKEQGKQREVSKRQAKSKKRREIQQEFTHSWMVGALKGHTAPILDMDFSANGKFLASCAEDRAEQQRGRHQLDKVASANTCTSTKSPSSSGLSPDKQKSPPSTPPSPTSSTKSNCSHDSESSSSSPLSTSQLQRAGGLSRRQRKNRTARAPREQRKELRERDEDHEDDHNGPPPSSSSASSSTSSSPMAMVSPVKGTTGRSRRGQGMTTPSKQQQPKQQKSPVLVGKTSGNGSKMSRAQKMSASGASLLRRKLNQLSDAEIALMLRQYVLTADELVYLGYPVCFWDSPEHVMIYSNRHGLTSCSAVNYHNHHKHQQQHNLDANAREFVPAGSSSSSTSCSGSEADSGNGTSASSSDQDEQESSCSSSGSDSDKASDCGQVDEPQTVQAEPEPEVAQPQEQEKRRPPNALERRCARCAKSFYARRSDGEYISEDKCLYHWGKLRRGHDGESYECCRGRSSSGGGSSSSPSKGCTVGRVHVWTGIVPGTNGPLQGYVRTRPAKYVSCDGNYGVYALDCEMCFTKNGLELGKVTVVALDGKLIYEAFCKPESEIIDYNTRFSGLRAKDLVNASKKLKDVQKDLLSFVSAETLLIGHGLENDLRALKIIHTQVVDTSLSYPHFKGFPFKYSLKALARTILNRDIQQLEHDSAEDARIAAELMLKKLQIDFFS
ncbi:hypothetical protein QAD02_015297 [Eretmocerus hayati]|uniref:Uncharacterized protein n=1 Tax=Eretmocerus hayati TaxID=131215 RepID=A0ACC2P7D5_9HYME|nr:hypothetical protein QAD02_015297 [Eretmocerus hayati]